MLQVKKFLKKIFPYVSVSERTDVKLAKKVLSLFITLILVYILEIYSNFIIFSKTYHCLTSNIDGMESIPKYFESSKKRDSSNGCKTFEELKKLNEITFATSMTNEYDVFSDALDNEHCRSTLLNSLKI